MDLKNYSTGVQHIGIPTNDIDKTVDFYHKLGFETAFETVNEEADVEGCISEAWNSGCRNI